MAYIYTIQMGQWRLARQQGIRLIDTTIKSGVRAFAPTWEMVQSYKAGELSEEDYTHLYRERINQLYRADPDVWKQYFDNNEYIALACYCRAGEFCHRHLLSQAVYNWKTQRDLLCVSAGEFTPEGPQVYPELNERIYHYLRR
jgi:uncharacterized protein YeaO (DUF488 family)